MGDEAEPSEGVVSEGSQPTVSNDAGSGAAPLRPKSGSWRAGQDPRIPWSPVGCCSPDRADPWFAGFGPPKEISGAQRKPHQPMITGRAQRMSRTGPVSETLYSNQSRRKPRKADDASEPSPSKQPRRFKPGSEDDPFLRLYDQRQKRQDTIDKIERKLEGNRLKSPQITKKARNKSRGAEERLQWADVRREKLESRRDEKQAAEEAEVDQVTFTPRITNYKPTRPPGEGDERRRRSQREPVPGEKVEERLLACGRHARDRMDLKRQEEERRFRTQAVRPVRPGEGEEAAHERLYKEAAQRRPQQEDYEGEVVESYPFSPHISKRSHVLAGGDLPRHEPVENRLLRQGNERKERQRELLARVEHQESLRSRRRSRSGGGGTTPRATYRDPTGVDNPRVVDQLKTKHCQDLTFKPYVGDNSKVIDKQVHGDGGWEKRILGLYHAHYTKELRLELLREEKDRQELLMCQQKRKAAATSSPVPGGEAGVHARGQAWAAQCERKLSYARQHDEEDTSRECTFEPAINTRSRSMAQRSSGYGPRNHSRSQSRVHPSPSHARYSAQRSGSGQGIPLPPPPPPPQSPPGPSPGWNAQFATVSPTRSQRIEPVVEYKSPLGGYETIASLSPPATAPRGRRDDSTATPGLASDSMDEGIEQERLALLRQIDFHRAAISLERQQNRRV